MLLYFCPDLLMQTLASLDYQLHVGRATVHMIIKKTSNAILEKADPLHLPVTSEYSWEEIARTYLENVIFLTVNTTS